MLRYRITASGCELAKKLVEADAMADSDCVQELKQVVNTDIRPSSAACESRLTDDEPASVSTAAAAAAAARSVNTALISDEERNWQKELLGFDSPEHDHSHEQR